MKCFKHKENVHSTYRMVSTAEFELQIKVFGVAWRRLGDSYDPLVTMSRNN